MRRRSLLALFVALPVTLEACATTVSLGPQTPLFSPVPQYQAFLEAKRQGERQLTTNSEDYLKALQELDQKFAEVITLCQRVLSGYEASAQRYRWISVGIALVGAISGAVVVPALTAAASHANAAYIAAFGGVSGAANTAQQTMSQQGLTAQEALTVRNNIRNQWDKALTDFFTVKPPATSEDPTNYLNQKYTALQQSRAACVNYAVATNSAEAAPAAPPTISNINPPSGEVGRTVSVVVTGTNLTNATVTVSGGKVVVKSRDGSTDTSLNLTFEIAQDATPGDLTVTVTTLAGNATHSFTVNAPKSSG